MWALPLENMNTGMMPRVFETMFEGPRQLWYLHCRLWLWKENLDPHRKVQASASTVTSTPTSQIRLVDNQGGLERPKEFGCPLYGRNRERYARVVFN